MPKVTDISRLPLQRLFNQLAAADFELTAHEWYRTELALAQHQDLLYSLDGLAELELILGPILCKNEKEQRRFKEIYQEFLVKLSSDVSQEAETPKTDPELKTASWWIPLAVLIGLLGLLSFGANWYQNNYGEAKNAARFQYEVIGDLSNFKLGDTLQLINQTTVKDTSQYSFSWYIQDEVQQVRWSHEGFEYRDLVFDNPNGILHSLHFIVRKRGAETQIYSGPVKQFRVNCAQAPIVKDIIEVSGERKVRETLQFSVETAGTGFSYQWDLGIDSLLTRSNPSWTFTEAG
ncbi:MAG: PKD domain-containing protein, partial [Bacteroidota bacterium]